MESNNLTIILCILIFLLLMIIIGSNLNKEEFQQPLLPIHIISMEKYRQDRLVRLLAKIQNDHRYIIRRIYAFDGSKNIIEGFKLKSGQIGCWRSHVEHWKDIQRQYEPYALILEDDADIKLPQLLPQIQQVIQELPTGWHICYIGGKYTEDKEIHRIAPSIVKSDSVMWHSHAYLITPQGADALLKMSANFNSDNKKSAWDNVTPVDVWMTHSDRKLNIYKTDPELVPFIDDNIHDTEAII